LIDPRLAVIQRRLERIGRIVVFSSGKGGVGKSLCSSVGALLLARRGMRVGLLDLDFHGASTHIFLGASLGFPEEEHGILPLPVGDEAAVRGSLRFMSVAAFTGDRAVPLRGEAVSNALIELLAVTIWGELDVLVVDMPPGIGDEVLDLVRFMERSEIVAISTASEVSVRVVERLLGMFLELGMPVLGVIENMALPERAEAKGSRPAPSPWVSGGRWIGKSGALADRDVPSLGSIAFIPEVEQALGSPARLLESAFADSLDRALGRAAGDPEGPARQPKG